MAYQKTVFKNGQAPAISAEELNKLGQGIEDLDRDKMSKIATVRQLNITGTLSTLNKTPSTEDTVNWVNVGNTVAGSDNYKQYVKATSLSFTIDSEGVGYAYGRAYTEFDNGSGFGGKIYYPQRQTLSNSQTFTETLNIEARRVRAGYEIKSQYSNNTAYALGIYISGELYDDYVIQEV